ncbi:O-antigen ligase family protein [Acinetobacter sp. YH16050]|uniref:O-antigen ligase family protein n=1 Tax=Acinetobacter sp. YH16050 TaxID=2601189 RepID=UPI0015D384FB
MELLVISRFFVDFFWDFKFLNFIHTAILLVFSMVLFFSQKNIDFKVIKPDIFIFFFAVVVSFSFFRSTDYYLAAIDFIKIIPCLGYYLVGRLWSGKVSTGRIVGFSYLSLALFLFVSFFDFSYSYLGNVKTFIAGYYFKTDIALAILIFMIFIFSYEERKNIKFFIFLISLYLIFITNSRISLPIAFFLLILSFFDINKLYKNISQTFILLILMSAVPILVFTYVDFSKFGLIGFDFSDPFSDSSTQGRNHIWEAIINFYNNQDFFNKIFGAGLASDILASKNYSYVNDFDAKRAHNSYLWMLVCIGWLGLFIFFGFLWSVFNEIKRKMIININSDYFYIFTSLTIVFLFMSLSVELIVKTQILYLLFLYAGLCCNRKIYR